MFMQKMSNLSHNFKKNIGTTATILRDYDRARFLCTQFLPREKRVAITALYALDAELNRLCTGNSELVIGHMRLKWWHSAVTDLFAGKIPHHPVAKSLAIAVSQGLEQSEIHKVIEFLADTYHARAKLCSFEDIEVYARNRQAPIYIQALNLLDERTHDREKAAGSAGLVTEIMAAFRTGRVVDDSIRLAHDTACNHVDQIISKYISRKCLCLSFLPLVLADIYLKRVLRAEFDLKHVLVKRDDPGVTAIPKLWWATRHSQ
ncbi:MAG: hypothetical protein CBB68_03335 [Rhodospirillaceae bacterium TMED8]|nr:hypothetical protein [Magnetovibrio sp.]OUT51923.1 MAG: hypothetical protein CBB68_03335 [Rhodospirillaceae bacterium TMED8]|tara:strand:+ start:345 stop:1127 length:783 start_codon:yes stop_codon:yes gene_type:complete